jgi:RHS repeat-associated protein
MRTNPSKYGLCCSSLVIAGGIIVMCFAVAVKAQDWTGPKQGVFPQGTYVFSNIETINPVAGNLTFDFPLGILPAGRNGFSSGTGLIYNSKIYDTDRVVYYDQYSNPVIVEELVTSVSGGWKYGHGYKLNVRHRPDDGDGYCNTLYDIYHIRVTVTYPDGSEREFRPVGFIDQVGDGYYTVYPHGVIASCTGYAWGPTGGMTYYSTDGTYTKLVVAYDNQTSGWTDNPWTLSFPDGKRVTYNEPSTGDTLRLYDANGNYVKIQNVTLASGNQGTKITDQQNRSVTVEYTSSDDYVHFQGVGSSTATWTVDWKLVPGGDYASFGSDSQYYYFSAPSQLVVDRIISPSQSGSLIHTFTYNTESAPYGLGEVRSITLPSSAQAVYSYKYGANVTPYEATHNHPTVKDLTYQREYDGASTSVTERWTYDLMDATWAKVTAPDGGVSKQWFHDCTPKPCWKDNLVYKSENPDGSVIERKWESNRPYGAGLINPYVSMEFTSVRDSGQTLSKTAIKEFKYDKNGNITQVAEYDWGNYSDVPRDFQGQPTGIPTGAPLKRVTVNTYYNPTPDASNTTTDDPDVYHKTTAPSIKNALEMSEVRADFTLSSALSRTEFSYDNASTTGNLTEQKTWDSTKGAISRPLGAGNSVSIGNTYTMWSSGATGKLTLATDARGYQTEFTYGAGSGFTDLYVTQTKTAYGTAVQRTTNTDYDFNTGLVTVSTDADNSVTTRTTYDVFGRPTLVEEADGISGIERQTQTEYSDTLRRVIVRKDKDATADKKLVSIEHYDQLGRLRLSRELEDASTQSATDETHGVKVQYRHAYSGSNSYTLVSAPYRANYSSGAGGEAGMAWKRTKFDSGGRILELETFVGSALPAPWGTSTASSGKVTTSYDANTTAVTDQANKQRRSVMDGLGRLIRVDEPDASNNLGGVDTPVQPTAYTYSALDKLIQIDQGAQTRTFGYSSLGRLTSATNPESGTVSYQYDNNANLTGKTDARAITTAYTYDALNRNKTVDYSNTAVSPDITRNYDGPIPYGKGRYWEDYAGGDYTQGQTVEYKKVDGYDAHGRALSQTQRFKTAGVWGSTYTVSRAYNLAGAVTEQTYPSGHKVNYTYDAAGDLEKFTGDLGTGGSPRTYADFIDYNAQGQMLYEQFGTNTVLHHNLHYNARGQLFDVRLGTQNGSRSTHVVNWGNATWDRGAIRTFFNSDLTDYTATPTWANNNGNVWRQDHFAPITTDVSQWAMAIAYYNYDTLNRVTGIWENKAGHATAETAVYTQQFLYDRWGNRRVNTAVSNVPGVPMAAMDVDTATNRLTVPSGQSGTISYDAAGNQTSDNWTMGVLGGGARTYDAENRMTSAVSGAGTSSYVYDADGRRVRRAAANGSSSQTWWQIYGLGGELVAEYELVSGTPTLRKEYGYRNGQLLVVADASTVQWTVTDALGTPRMVVDQTGSLGTMKRHDYLPFGEEVLANVGLRETTMGYTGYAGTQSIRQQFTGKERDVETGLDYFLARYYSGYQGRFTSPDEFTGGPDELYDFADAASDNPTFYADLFEPQSLNKYQYTYNRPLVMTDGDGHLPIFVPFLVAAIVYLATNPDTVNAPGPRDPVYPTPAGNALFGVVTGPGGRARQGIRAANTTASVAKPTSSIKQATPNKVTWVDEKAAMKPNARDYQATAAGARSNPATRSPQAPQISYTNSAGSNKTVRFDGVDGNVMVDRKLSVVTTTKAQNQAQRQSEALRQNNLRGRWEVPTQAEANRAAGMFKKLGIDNIDVRVVPQ